MLKFIYSIEAQWDNSSRSFWRDIESSGDLLFQYKIQSLVNKQSVEDTLLVISCTINTLKDPVQFLARCLHDSTNIDLKDALSTTIDWVIMFSEPWLNALPYKIIMLLYWRLARDACEALYQKLCWSPAKLDQFGYDYPSVAHEMSSVRKIWVWQENPDLNPCWLLVKTFIAWYDPLLNGKLNVPLPYNRMLLEILVCNTTITFFEDWADICSQPKIIFLCSVISWR